MLNRQRSSSARVCPRNGLYVDGRFDMEHVSPRLLAHGYVHVKGFNEIWLWLQVRQLFLMLTQGAKEMLDFEVVSFVLLGCHEVQSIFRSDGILLRRNARGRERTVRHRWRRRLKCRPIQTAVLAVGVVREQPVGFEAEVEGIHDCKERKRTSVG